MVVVSCHQSHGVKRYLPQPKHAQNPLCPTLTRHLNSVLNPLNHPKVNCTICLQAYLHSRRMCRSYGSSGRNSVDRHKGKHIDHHAQKDSGHRHRWREVVDGFIGTYHVFEGHLFSSHDKVNEG